MRSALVFMFIFFQLITLIGQPGDGPPNPKPGKCYAKCLINESKVEWKEVICEADLNTSVIKNKICSLLFKNGYNVNCNNFYFGSVEIRAVTNQFSKDHNLPIGGITPEFINHLEILPGVIRENGKCFNRLFTASSDYQKTEWTEILCDNRINEALIENIRIALISEGYNAGENTHKWSGVITNALNKYQRDNHLPLGDINIETLKDLGIKL